MNGVDKDHRPELWLDIPASADHWVYCKKKYLYVLFSGTVMLVQASLCVPSLSLVCACACSRGRMLFPMCESLKFEGVAMGVMVLWQCFHLKKCECFAVQWSPGNIIFASCRRRSCLSRFFTWFSHCSTILSTEFAIFVLSTKHFLITTLAIYCGKAYSICNK